MKNSWNHFVYACWTPFYDLLIGISFFSQARRKAIQLLNPQAGQRLLIVGIGTGADLPLLPQGLAVTGVDLSPTMLRSARKKAENCSLPVELIEADAARMPFADDSFDAVLLFLILSVVESPQDCLREVERVAIDEAPIVVFDKFLDTQKPSWSRWLLNILTRFFGTDINRNFEAISQKTNIEIVSQESHGWGKSYQLMLLRNGSC